MAWIGAVVGAASSYMSAKEQNKVAKEAAKPRPSESYRTPYGNEYISKLIPYILGSQQQVFESRMRGYGLEPQDFSSYKEALAGVPSNYSGVGKPGAPIFSGEHNVPDTGSMPSVQAARKQYNENHPNGPEENPPGPASSTGRRVKDREGADEGSTQNEGGGGIDRYWENVG